MTVYKLNTQLDHVNSKTPYIRFRAQVEKRGTHFKDASLTIRLKRDGSRDRGLCPHSHEANHSKTAILDL